MVDARVQIPKRYYSSGPARSTNRVRARADKVLSRDKAKSAVQNIAAGGAQVLIAAFGVLAGTRYIFVPRTAYKLKGTVRPVSYTHLYPSGGFGMTYRYG